MNSRIHVKTGGSVAVAVTQHQGADQAAGEEGLQGHSACAHRVHLRPH